MAAEIPTSEPTVFVAGTTWEWDKSFADFPASDGWELTYYFRSKVAANGDLTAAWGQEVTANGDTFEIRIAFANTNLTPGAYDLVGEITDGTKKHLVCNEAVDVLPAPSTAGAKSFALTMLDAIEARMEGRDLSVEQKRLQINGRSVEFATDAELQAARAYWLLVVGLERNPDARLQHAVRMTG